MKPKIRVLHLIDSGGLYGAENVVINLSIGLNKSDCQSIIGCFTYEKAVTPEVGKKAESLGLETVFFKLSNKFDLTCARKIAAYCRKNGITLVHSHGYKPSLVCLLLKIFYGIPYVITCHLWYINNLRLKVYTLVEKISMLFAEKVIGVSEDIVVNLEKAGVPHKKLKVIDNGIDISAYSEIESFDESMLREELGLEKESLIIGSLGRLTEQKDYRTFLQAAAELLKEKEGIEFIIAGDGEMKSDLVSFAKNLGIDNKFHFLGFRSDKVHILKLMDIFVLSSLDEGLPIAMLEAMATRLPIVTTKVGGIPKVIKNGVNGLFIEKNDYKQLKESLLLLINDNRQRDILGKEGYETVKMKYSNEMMTRRYINVYNELILSANRKRGCL